LSPNRPKADKKRFYVNDLILLKNEPQIVRKPIKEDIIFIIEFFWKISPKSAEADKRGFNVHFLILLKNGPKIDLRPIKGDFMFII
jgi:hypothetical protein